MPVTEPAVTATAAGTPSKATAALMVVACIILVVLAVVHLRFIIPVFASMLSGAGREFSAPTRLAIGVARFGPLLLILWAVAFGVLYRRGRQTMDAVSRFHTFLSASTVVFALYVALVSCAYLDVAIALPQIAK